MYWVTVRSTTHELRVNVYLVHLASGIFFSPDSLFIIHRGALYSLCSFYLLANHLLWHWNLFKVIVPCQSIVNNSVPSDWSRGRWLLQLSDCCVRQIIVTLASPRDTKSTHWRGERDALEIDAPQSCLSCEMIHEMKDNVAKSFAKNFTLLSMLHEFWRVNYPPAHMYCVFSLTLALTNALTTATFRQVNCEQLSMYILYFLTASGAFFPSFSSSPPPPPQSHRVTRALALILVFALCASSLASRSSCSRLLFLRTLVYGSVNSSSIRGICACTSCTSVCASSSSSHSALFSYSLTGKSSCARQYSVSLSLSLPPSFSSSLPPCLALRLSHFASWSKSTKSDHHTVATHHQRRTIKQWIQTPVQPFGHSHKYTNTHTNLCNCFSREFHSQILFPFVIFTSAFFLSLSLPLSCYSSASPLLSPIHRISLFVSVCLLVSFTLDVHMSWRCLQ